MYTRQPTIIRFRVVAPKHAGAELELVAREGTLNRARRAAKLAGRAVPGLGLRDVRIERAPSGQLVEYAGPVS